MNRKTDERNTSVRPGSRGQAIQRWIAILGGGTLAAVGLKRFNKAGIALAAGGGLLAYVGATSSAQPRELIAAGSVLINCSAQDAYRLWSDPLNLPLFMRHLDSVTSTGEGRYRWVALGPTGSQIVWDTETVRMKENESIEWRSLPGSELETEGRVEFGEAPAKRGTELRVAMRYSLSSGGTGRLLSRYLTKVPSFWLQQDLRRLKALMETGEIPTIEGQSHGRRSAKIAALRLADPDRPLRPESRLIEEFSAARRIA